MSAKIINSHRYKTITKTQLDKKRKKSEKQAIKSNRKKSYKTGRFSSIGNSLISNVRFRKHKERKLEREFMLYSKPQDTVIKEPKQKLYIPKSFVVACLSIVLVILAYIAAKIMHIDDRIALSAFFNKEENVQLTLTNNYELKIGLNTLNSTDLLRTNNLVVNEINKLAYLSLIKINQDYSISYDVASNIIKLSQREYLIKINDKSKIVFEDVKSSIERIIAAGEDNMYYDRLKDISTIEKTNNKDEIKITLNNDNPYFLYYLDFPIVSINEKVLQYFNASSDENNITYTKSISSSTLSKIILNSYDTIDETVEDFILGKLDIFFATSNNDMQLIGKKDYNTKKYKDGETLFLLGNSNSKLFSRKEVRTAIMYCINREDIIKNSDNTFLELIDLPFIYSTVKYKYDTVGADNIMVSNGWNKNKNGIYEHNDGTVATFDLLVNQEDQDKLTAANQIKDMLDRQGIYINIISIKQGEIETRVSNGQYDLVLANIYLNEIPNVEFLRKYLDINSETTQAFLQVENSTVEELFNNIKNLEYVLSNEVSCIGIYARNINLVYQKYITGFEELNYMRIFSNIDKIGKVLE